LDIRALRDASRKGHPRVLVLCVNGICGGGNEGSAKVLRQPLERRSECTPLPKGCWSRRSDKNRCSTLRRNRQDVRKCKSAGDHLHVVLGKICAHTKGAPRSLLALDATANADHHRLPLHLDLESSARALGHSSHGTLPCAVRVR